MGEQMIRILGTPYEISLRILLMLNEASGQSFTLDKIVAFDFIAIYARDFGLSKTNLHGYSSYRFGEFAGRRELVRSGIKQLVLNATVIAMCAENGFEYSISESGKNFASKMICGYAGAYQELITKALLELGDESERSLYDIISQRTLDSLRKG